VSRLRLLAVPVAIAALGAAPSAALAHAQLEGTSPQRDATVKAQPGIVSFRFDESVEGNFGAVRVYDSAGRRVDAGDAFHPGGRGAVMGVHLKPHLPAGTYTATYRVVSADGHIVSSGFVFSIGHPGAAGKTVASLLAGTKVGEGTNLAYGAARGAQYAAIALAVGAVLFLLLSWFPALIAAAGAAPEWERASQAFARRLTRLLAVASLVGMVSAAAGVVLEAASAAGISGWSALRWKVVHEELGTHFGTVWGIAVFAWALSAAVVAVLVMPARQRALALRPAELGATGLALAPRRTLVALAALGPPLAFVTVLPAFAGHASTQRPVALMFPTNVVHVLAMSVWAGGLAALLYALPAATRALEPVDRTRLLAAVLRRFSPVALAAVCVIVASGLIQAYEWVRTPAHLIDTPYGRCVLIKICLLTGLIALGAFNRRRSVPELSRLASEGATPGRAGVELRRALRAEVALIVVVLGVTAALSAYAPSTQAYTGPANLSGTVGPAQLEMTVDPARVGANQVHLYLLNPKDGTQFTKAREVDVSEVMPAKGIGPLQQGATLAGPGHYIDSSALLGVPGKWRLTVTVRTSEFDEYTRTFTVNVR
jgi:copper transport protein